MLYAIYSIDKLSKKAELQTPLLTDEKSAQNRIKDLTIIADHKGLLMEYVMKPLEVCDNYQKTEELYSPEELKILM